MSSDVSRETSPSPSPSLYALLRTTPMRDLLHGRLSGRLDVERIIATANPPAPVSETIRAVVRRTRLSGLEKADLASELVAHFQDGLEAGATAGELVGAFGDVRQAARLMRRAKLRGRNPVWKVWSLAFRAGLTMFVLLLAAYGVQAIRVFSAEPVLKLNVLATINADALSIPEAQRAWRVYRAAALATTAPPKDLDLRSVHPRHAEWDAAVAYATENAEVVRQYRAAATMAKIGIVYSTASDPELDLRYEDDRAQRLADAQANQPEIEDNPLAIGITLPQLGVLREGAQLLRVDATIAAEDGDADIAMADVVAMFGIVEHAEQMPFVISDLVSLAVLDMTTVAVGRLLSEHANEFSDAQLTELSHRVAGVRAGTLDVDIRSERLFFEDVLQRFYSDDGAGDGYLIRDAYGAQWEWYGASGFSPGKVLTPAVSLLLAGRSEMLTRYDEIMALAESDVRTPIWLLNEYAADAELIKLSAEHLWLRYAPIHILMPSLSRAGLMAWRATQRRDATLAALALELYRRDHGDWPASLEAVSPRYLPTVPLDQFDGLPLKYAIVNGRPLLYSVGADRKDDGGRIDSSRSGHYRAQQWASPAAIAQARQDPEWSSPTSSQEIADGDWVLWPPVD